MTKTDKRIDYGAMLDVMKTRERIVELMEEIGENNFELMNLLNKLPPKEYNEYLPKVQKMIADTAIKQPEDDIPETLFMQPGTANLKND